MKQFILIFQTILISSIVFGQNTNPYKVFGCTNNTNYEIPLSCMFRVNNSDSKSNIKALAIDFDKSLTYLLGENDSIIKTLNIDPEEVLIWLSTDPKSDKYPSHSPYHYCSNNPIMRVDPDGRADDWYENSKGEAIWLNSKANSYTDKDGNNYKNIGQEYLRFDGSNLVYYTQKENKDGNLTLYKTSFGAVSGKPDANGNFSYSQRAQATSGGPIPEGLYFINPQEIQNYNNLSGVDKMFSNVGMGTFPGGTNSWGENRVWIQPNTTFTYSDVTEGAVYRSDMSIHGGNEPGSRGCIDLHKNANYFFNMLSDSKGSFIRLNVNYTR
jgi:hypothetical protein